ncbi:MAG: hypothetical protein NVS2B12_37800 [Ktedonobacteraceae bacterium]
MAASSSNLVIEQERTGEKVSRLAGVLLILSVVGFYLPFSILLFGLHFTDQPADVSFTLFRQQGALILSSYYALAWGGLFLILAVLVVHRLLNARGSLALLIATSCGVLGGLMQAIGYLRWPFLLPTLAETYLDPKASEATRSAVALIFQSVDQFAGVELSEHLYYLFIGAWSLLLGWYLLQAGLVRRWVAWLGVITGCGLLICSIEQFDLSAISTLLLVFVLLVRLAWGVWILILASNFLRAKAA